MRSRRWRCTRSTRPAPRRAAAGRGTEFFVWFTLTVPAGTPAQVAEATVAAEGRRVTELAAQGQVTRIWRLPDGRTLGLYRAADPAGLDAILRSLPLYSWLTTQVTPLTPHPSDPGISRE